MQDLDYKNSFRTKSEQNPYNFKFKNENKKIYEVEESKKFSHNDDFFNNSFQNKINNGDFFEKEDKKGKSFISIIIIISIIVFFIGLALGFTVGKIKNLESDVINHPDEAKIEYNKVKSSKYTNTNIENQNSIIKENQYPINQNQNSISKQNQYTSNQNQNSISKQNQYPINQNKNSNIKENQFEIKNNQNNSYQNNTNQSDLINEKQSLTFKNKENIQNNVILGNYVIKLGVFPSYKAKELIDLINTKKELKAFKAYNCKNIKKNVINSELAFRINVPQDPNEENLLLGCFADRETGKKLINYILAKKLDPNQSPRLYEISD